MNFLRQLLHSKIGKLVLVTTAALVLSFAAGGLLQAKTAVAESGHSVNLYLFWGDGCPHCAHAKEFLEPYVAEHSEIGYETFEVYYSAENQQKMQAVSTILEADASGIPFMIVGNEPYVGFSEATGDKIIERLEYCSSNACPDSVATIVGVEPAGRGGESSSAEPQKDNQLEMTTQEATDENVVTLPVFGDVDVAHLSLPILTAIFGLLDGFNPCAMWALLFIITLLVGMNDRRKMWLFGTTFIAVSALVYLVFMAAWLNLFLFIGHIVWIRSAIGLLAIIVGAYYLYDWHLKRTGCAVTGNEKRKAVFVRLRAIVKEKNVWLALGGIALLAAAVNIVELACSAGLPVIYTGILSAAGLETWQYYAYMLLYVLFFMLDDLIVFGIAMATFKVVGIDSKYTRATRFVGGTVMVILGLLLIFAPEVLMFG